MPRKLRKARRGIFGKKMLTVEEEHSLLLFVAGIMFGIGLVSMLFQQYYYTAFSLLFLVLVLLFIDKRIEAMR